MSKIYFIKGEVIFGRTVPYTGLTTITQNEGVIVNLGGIIGFDLESNLANTTQEQATQALKNINKCLTIAGEYNGLPISRNALRFVTDSKVGVTSHSPSDTDATTKGYDFIKLIKECTDIGDSTSYESIFHEVRKLVKGRNDFEAVDIAYVINKMPMTARTVVGVSELPLGALVQITASAYIPKDVNQRL